MNKLFVSLFVTGLLLLIPLSSKATDSVSSVQILPEVSDSLNDVPPVNQIHLKSMHYGVTIGGATLSSLYNMLTSDFVAEYKFNRLRYLGLGTGFHVFSNRFGNELSKLIPFYISYTRYYPLGDTGNTFFFLGSDLGLTYCLDNVSDPKVNQPSLMTKFKLGWEFCLSEHLAATLELNCLFEAIPSLGLSFGIAF